MLKARLGNWTGPGEDGVYLLDLQVRCSQELLNNIVTAVYGKSLKNVGPATAEAYWMLASYLHVGSFKSSKNPPCQASAAVFSSSCGSLQFPSSQFDQQVDWLLTAMRQYISEKLLPLGVYKLCCHNSELRLLDPAAAKGSAAAQARGPRSPHRADPTRQPQGQLHAAQAVPHDRREHEFC